YSIKCRSLAFFRRLSAVTVTVVGPETDDCISVFRYCVPFSEVTELHPISARHKTVIPVILFIHLSFLITTDNDLSVSIGM
ncbi:hypothetical protein, partial [Cronobacter sakazakii]|uniref:hypothetical protein n=1 Tax=Cronobacter sakazakii TaxID=28141 RepID=UPI001C61172D